MSDHDAPRPGEPLGQWRVADVELRHGRLRLFMRGRENPENSAVLGLSAARPGDDLGAFGRDGTRCWYEGKASAAALQVAADAVFRRLGARPAEQLSAWLTENDAKTRADERVARPLTLGVPPQGTVLGGDWRALAHHRVDDSVEATLQGADGTSAILVIRPTTGDNVGPLGAAGAHIAHKGHDPQPGLAEAASAWLTWVRREHGGGSAHVVVATILGDPLSAGLATAQRSLRLPKGWRGDPDTLARLVSAVEPGTTTSLLIQHHADHAALAASLRGRADPAVQVTLQQSDATARADGVARSDIPGELEHHTTAPPPHPTPSRRHEWRTELRRLLTDQPDARVRLGDVLPPAELPAWPCALPWIRFAVSPSGWLGPCCHDYQASHHRIERDGQPLEHWNGPGLRAFRRAMTSGGHPSTCSTSCPFLLAGTQRPADVVLHGGPVHVVDNALLVVEDLLAGREIMTGRPLQLCIAATTFCNYDCVMCDYGETGTLDDELTASFWTGLEAALETAQFLEVNGGEPLGSPVFREWLGRLDRELTPQLRVLLITNGSYLGGKQLSKYRKVPFENITLSVNAATGPTYEKVNRGLPWERARRTLDEIAAARRRGELSGRVQYSMVLLRDNLDEIGAFADLAIANDATIRYQLPLRDRGGSSIMTDAEAMLRAMGALQEVAARLLAMGRLREAQSAAGNAEVLWQRLAAGIFQPL